MIPLQSAGLPGGEELDRPTPDARPVKRSSYFTGRRVVEWYEYLFELARAREAFDR